MKNLLFAAILLFTSTFALSQAGKSADDSAQKEEGGHNCGATTPVNAKRCYGALGDLQVANKCAIASGSATLACFGASFKTTDIGKTVYVHGAGPRGVSLSSKILSVASGTSVGLSSPAVTTVQAAPAAYATDDTAALQNAYDYAVGHGAALYIPGGAYLHHGLNWTNNTMAIYGDAYAATDLYAMEVVNPGKKNSGAQGVGVDISASGYNKIQDVAFWGAYPGFVDLAPRVNVLAGRAGPGGQAFAIAHTFENDFFATQGEYNVVLYGYEQADFHNCHFETSTVRTSGNLYLSAANTPRFVSPYVNLVPAPASMTKVNVSGGRSVFAGIGKMIVLDQGSTESNYTISIRDAYTNMADDSIFLSDTGSGALRHIVLDTVYAEVGKTSVGMIKVNGPAWNWRVDNAQIYNATGLTVSPFIFNGGFLDSEALIDSTGQAGGHADPEFSSPSCLGSVLHLGQQQPTTNCTNYAFKASTKSYLPGFASSGATMRPYPFVGYPSARWVKLGTWIGSGAGDTLHLSIDSANGESPRGNQQGFVEISSSISNKTAAPNVTGITAWQFGNTSPISNVLIASTGESNAPGNLSWDVWVEVAAYAIGTYRVAVSDGASWTNLSATGKPPSGDFVVQGNVNNVMNTSGKAAAPTQAEAVRFTGSCTMVSSTTCTMTLPSGYKTPVCITSTQGKTPVAGSCVVGGTTVTVTAASANSQTWGVMVNDGAN